MTKHFPFFFAITCVFLAGCAGMHEPIKTERVSLPGKTVEQVRDAAVSYLVGAGWTLKNSDALMFRFEKESGFAEQMLYNKVGSQATRDRYTLTLLSSPAGVDLLGHLVVVYKQFGNDQENSTDKSNARGVYLTSCVRASILGEPIPALPVSTNSAPVATKGGQRK